MEQLNVPEEMKVAIDYENEELPETVKTLRPLVFKEGDGFCCLLGPDPQAGVFGCGQTPREALDDWDKHLHEKVSE
ncbi:MAG: hypothetical protein JWQ09_4455 [Segetibacter sp.]|nr:hypothetical protein [Segetibacter sp.]